MLASLGEANRADVVFSTVDTVGIPLILLRRAGRVRPPLVYAAIGLPERLARLRGERMRRLYASALGTAATIVAYSEYEAETLRGWLEDRGRSTPVGFVPFGVNTKAFRPSKVLPSGTSCRSVRIRIVTTSSFSRSRRRCRRRRFSS